METPLPLRVGAATNVNSLPKNSKNLPLYLPTKIEGLLGVFANSSCWAFELGINPVLFTSPVDANFAEPCNSRLGLLNKAVSNTTLSTTNPTTPANTEPLIAFCTASILPYFWLYLINVSQP